MPPWQLLPPARAATHAQGWVRGGTNCSHMCKRDTNHIFFSVPTSLRPDECMRSRRARGARQTHCAVARNTTRVPSPGQLLPPAQAATQHTTQAVGAPRRRSQARDPQRGCVLQVTIRRSPRQARSDGGH